MVSIYNSMSDRRHEIAIMRALGASRRTVMWVILLESILLSLGGGVLGLLLGHGLIGVLGADDRPADGRGRQPAALPDDRVALDSRSDRIGLGGRLSPGPDRLSHRRCPLADEHTMTTPRQDSLARSPYGRYRAMSVAAVTSLVFGAVSVLTFVHWAMGLVPAAGVLAGILALRQIRHAPEEYTGGGLAWLGIGLCVAFWAAGYGWLMFARASEVPWGYQRVSYEMLQPNPDVAGEQIPPAVFDLQDKKVFVIGYIAPGRQQTRLRRFILCPAIANCQFCTPNPKPTEMILVSFEGDLETDYTIHPIRSGRDVSRRSGLAEQDPLSDRSGLY